MELIYDTAVEIIISLEIDVKWGEFLTMNDEIILDSLKGDKKVSFNESVKRLSISESIAETVRDPFCDENNPRIISFQDVCQAVCINDYFMKEFTKFLSFYRHLWFAVASRLRHAQ